MLGMKVASGIYRVLEIAQIGDPQLVQKAEPVDPSTITDPEFQNLLRNMEATMYDAKGIGLAAPQIRVSKRIIVFYLPASRDSCGVDVPFTVLINPVIEILETERVSDWEGCLSVAGKRGMVPRYTKIRYSGLDANGKQISRVAEGWHARVVQHECDHLDGILYPEVMAGEDDLLSIEEWKAFQMSQAQ